MEQREVLIHEISHTVQDALECAELLHHSYEVIKLRYVMELIAKLEAEIYSDQSYVGECDNIVDVCMKDLKENGIEK